MARKKTVYSLTPFELQIMQVLWQHGPSSVGEVRGELKPLTELAYNTVQTMLYVLERKGKVERRRRDRAYEYWAKLSQEEALDQALHDIVGRICEGSWDKLLASVTTARQQEQSKRR